MTGKNGHGEQDGVHESWPETSSLGGYWSGPTCPPRDRGHDAPFPVLDGWHATASILGMQYLRYEPFFPAFFVAVSFYIAFDGWLDLVQSITSSPILIQLAWYRALKKLS